MSMKRWTTKPWMCLSKADLNTEREQCRDEGKDLAKYEAEFDALLAAGLDEDLALQPRAGKLLDRTLGLRPKKDFPYREPSALADIRKARRARPGLPKLELNDAALRDKAYGAWLGRAAGCLLGKPVEGQPRANIEGYLRAHNCWPLSAYFPKPASEEARAQFKFPKSDNACYRENITCMVEDDDTNYTATGLAVVERFGKNFTPANMAEFWLGNIPLFHVCTAERVAYRNLAMLVAPPDSAGKVDGKFSSATFRNPYREWIGAQIRADFFGYVCPGNPERAAELAFHDAAISHVKNGIYGEMWVAAMLAAAYLLKDNAEQVIRAGLGEIPAKSRLHADLEEVFNWRKEGLAYGAAVDRLHAKWKEANSHHWCHTNSNAQIVALALLYGGLDYEKTVTYAVMPGFDTDCNGATAGSVLGLMLGASALPAKWLSPLNDTLLTGVAGYHRVKLSQMADKTLELIKKE